MAANLKPELKKAILGACSKCGFPPMVDKTINSIYDEFKKSQPLKLAEKGLSDSWKETIDVWVNLENCLKKYVDPNMTKIVGLTITALKKIFGENPTEMQVRLMVT